MKTIEKMLQPDSPYVFYDSDHGYCINTEDVMRLIRAAREPDWVPCTKRMPEEHEWIGTKKFGTTISDEVYVTFETPDGERFAKHISFQNGKLSSVDEQHLKAWFNGAIPIAWRPLPEPYRGGGHQ